MIPLLWQGTHYLTEEPIPFPLEITSLYWLQLCLPVTGFICSWEVHIRDYHGLQERAPPKWKGHSHVLSSRINSICGFSSPPSPEHCPRLAGVLLSEPSPHQNTILRVWSDQLTVELFLSLVLCISVTWKPLDLFFLLAFLCSEPLSGRSGVRGGSTPGGYIP